MTVFTTTQFASSAAQGGDWREASKAVLEDLSSIQTEGAAFNIGFLYISDHLAEHAESILGLFKSVLNIGNWVGGVGVGICANGESFIDVPAVSAMIGHFDEEAFTLFPPMGVDNGQALEDWQKNHDPMLMVVTGDPMGDESPENALADLDTICSGFMVGGLTSSRQNHAQYAGDIHEGGVCGVTFSIDVPVVSTLSQGCNIVGGIHSITRCDGHEIMELDGKPTVEVFEEDLRTMVIKKADLDPDTVMVDESALKNPDDIPEEFQTLIKGEVHAALPISESDQNDYLVRNIMGIDPDSGAMMISHHVANGDRIMFVHRDNASVYSDLSKSLVDLRARVERDTGGFAPKGALYISCAARAFGEFEGDHKNEMELIREIIGDVPLTGFYAGGEINKARLYGYTGILTLFL